MPISYVPLSPLSILCFANYIFPTSSVVPIDTDDMILFGKSLIEVTEGKIVGDGTDN